MTTKVECHSSGVEDSAEEEVGSPSVSIGSSSSGFSVSALLNGEKESKVNEETLSTSRTHLPLIVQKEMSKLFAARCDATQSDLIPFKVVMDIIREHFILSNKPELLRVLIRLLCQYQPLQGEKEYKKLTSLCEDLLISVDEEVRDAFISMIPVPIDCRQNFLPQTNVIGCGHYVRNSGRKEDMSNPLAELVKRPLLSYQTMPAPLFQQPFIKPSGTIPNRSGNLDQTKDPYKYFNFSAPIPDISKSESEILNKTPAHSSVCHNSWMASASTALPISASSNSLMWFARTTSQSPIHSPPGRQQGGNSRHSLLTASLMPNLTNFNQYDAKKQLIQLESAVNPALLPPNFSISCLNASNYCEQLRPTNSSNLELSRHPCTINSDIATACYLENRIDQDNRFAFKLLQLLKRPETPDCSDPWGNGKKPRRQNKPCPINSLMSRKKKKSKK